MGALLIVTAVDRAPWEKGDIVTAIDAAKDPGRLTGPPAFVRVHITDAAVDKALDFVGQAKSVFTYAEIVRNDEGVRLEISTERKLVDRYGLDKGIRDDLYEWLQEEYGAQKVVAQSDPPYMYRVDIPDPDLDNETLKRRFKDVAEEYMAPSRLCFSDADVDAILGAGGQVERTRSQVLAAVLHRADLTAATRRR